MQIDSRLKKLETVHHANPANCNHPEEKVQWFVIPYGTYMSCTLCQFYGPCPDDRPQPENDWPEIIAEAKKAYPPDRYPEAQ